MFKAERAIYFRGESRRMNSGDVERRKVEMAEKKAEIGMEEIDVKLRQLTFTRYIVHQNTKKRKNDAQGSATENNEESATEVVVEEEE
jgi:hypothetical protein